MDLYPRLFAAMRDAGGQLLRWKKVSADRHGFVNLADSLEDREWCLAYAYAEFEEIHGRETVLSCGSDDGIAVWINGEPVHKNEIGRGYAPGADSATIYLKPGVNRILVKIDNYTGGWGFGVSIPKAAF